MYVCVCGFSLFSCLIIYIYIYIWVHSLIQTRTYNNTEKMGGLCIHLENVVNCNCKEWQNNYCEENPIPRKSGKGSFDS